MLAGTTTVGRDKQSGDVVPADVATGKLNAQAVMVNARRK